MSPLTRAVMFLILITGFGMGDSSAQPKFDSNHKDWTVYTQVVDGETVCFASTPASDMAPKSADHGLVHLFVSSWKSSSGKAQPSIRVGYQFKPELSPKMKIGRSTWSFFTAGRESFALDEDDSQIVRALKAGSEARFEAISDGGTAMVYHFSLSGSTAAIERAVALCR